MTTMLDAMVVAAALTGAVGYLVWRLLPVRRGRSSPCAACPAREAHRMN